MAPITRCCCTVIRAFNRSGSVSSTFCSTSCSTELPAGQRQRPLEELGEVGGVTELDPEVEEEAVHLPADGVAEERLLAAREQAGRWWPATPPTRRRRRRRWSWPSPGGRWTSYAPREHLEAGVVHRSCASSVPAAQRPSSGSRPTVSPGRSPTAFTASSTPGMNDVRSYESWRMRQRLPGGAEQHLLVGDEAAQAHRVHVDPAGAHAAAGAVDHRLGGGVGCPLGRTRRPSARR